MNTKIKASTRTKAHERTTEPRYESFSANREERPAIQQTVRVPKIAEVVADHIRRQIVRGDLSEGDTLAPESEFIERFGVSRPTLREALRILESENLIQVTRGARGGARVQMPDSRVAARYAGLILQRTHAPLTDIYEAQLAIEPPAVRILAERGDPETIQGLRDCIAMERDTVEHPPHFGSALARFHHMVVDRAGNQVLSLLATMLHDILELHFAASTGIDYLALPARTVRERAIRSHEKLVNLIAAGKIDAAERHWRALLKDSAKIMTRSAKGKTVVDLFD